MLVFTLSRLVAAVLSLCLTLALAGCGPVGPGLQDQASNTPAYYTENKMFYLQPLSGSDPSKQETVRLQHVFERVNSPVVGGASTQPAPVPIGADDPLAVVLQAVRLPEDLPGGKQTRDIAVVLDVVMSPEKGLQSLVAYYQRDVPAGQTLNFSNLLVFATPRLDPTVAPYFRVRVLDVRAERNRETRKVLDEVSKLNGEISGLVPHPVIPIVGRAIEVAAAILSNQQNQTLLDFQVQLFQAAQAAAAGDADLGQLYEGKWLVLGRPIGRQSDAWKDPMALERKTDRIVSLGEAKLVSVPYVSVVLMRADLQVPAVIMDRSQAFLQLLASPAGKTNVEALRVAAAGLTAAVRVYALERGLITDHSKQAMIDAANLVIANDPDQPREKEVGPGELAVLIRAIAKAADRPELSSPKLVIDWWNSGGGKDGNFEQDSKSKTWKWVAKAAGTGTRDTGGSGAGTRTSGAGT